VQFIPGKKPWEVKTDIAIPCATQNELDLDDAKSTGTGNGCFLVAEASNMGCTAEAAEYLGNTSGMRLERLSMQEAWLYPVLK
jgi:glutamate dehydrogenase (NADP+)